MTNESKQECCEKCGITSWMETRCRHVNCTCHTKPPEGKELLLTDGTRVLVDETDFDWLNQWKWRLHKNERKTHRYAIRSEYIGGKSRYRPVFMHKEILQIGPEKQGDHINGDTLDNRRKNLRAVTPLQNRQNQRLRSDNRSGHPGVSWNIRERVWIARLTVKGRRVLEKRFKKKEDAIAAREAVAKKLHGDYFRKTI